MKAATTIGIRDFVRQYDLPLEVLHRWLDRNGYTVDRRWPLQCRRIDVDKISEILRRLKADGFSLPSKKDSAHDGLDRRGRLRQPHWHR